MFWHVIVRRVRTCLIKKEIVVRNVVVRNVGKTLRSSYGQECCG